MTPDQSTECLGCRAALRIGLNPALCDIHLNEQRAAVVRKQEETHAALVECAKLLKDIYEQPCDEIDCTKVHAALKRLEEIK